MSSEWLRSSRNNTSLALILVDVDYFKRFNDSMDISLATNAFEELHRHPKRD